MPNVAKGDVSVKSVNAMEGIKGVVVFIEKKIRNLEKRKNKLDDYQKKKDKGTALDVQQQEALDMYGTVMNNLEFAKEVLLHVQQTVTECEKVSKKTEKKQKMEKERQSQEQMKFVVVTQAVLEEMGDENVRSLFTQSDGRDGVRLQQEQVDALDELYEVITPRRDAADDVEQSWSDRLVKAADGLVSLVESRDKSLSAKNGITYKEAHGLVETLSLLPYFQSDKPPVAPQAVNNVESPSPALALSQPSYLQHEDEAIVNLEPAAVTSQMNGGHHYHHQQQPVQPVVSQKQQQQQQHNRRTITDIHQEVADKHQFNFIQDSELSEPMPCGTSWADDTPVKSVDSTPGGGDVFASATQSDFLKEKDGNEWNEPKRGGFHRGGGGGEQSSFQRGRGGRGRDDGSFHRGGGGAAGFSRGGGGGQRGGFRGGRGRDEGGFHRGSGGFHRGGSSHRGGGFRGGSNYNRGGGGFHGNHQQQQEA